MLVGPFHPPARPKFAFNAPLIGLAGFLVGFGARLGDGRSPS
jgi:hypothetical protein